MLKLKGITKEYYVADTTVHALKGIDLCFRKNEFVSILGPSGCGKTTLLNIVGGLDKYTNGDLVIGGKSTREFNDRDWDVYRNHRIGFIFQSYNLIPHQTILGNVELALTISGINKQERIERAKKALDKVGLQGQYNKKPNQLSGGQCQRVAIARALVNEPEILLADEPTGALDTVTSVQIMDLIKEIASEKLVIMVTHNPELAEKYSTRIVNLLDGEVLNDSNPFSEEDEKAEIEAIREAEKKDYEAGLALIDQNNPKDVKEYNKKKNAKERAKMSMWTATKLSARNLYSKLKRTIMVVIAGSIGIIGVSAVLAVSQGVRDYIANMQDDLLSEYPIEVAESGVDYNALLNSSIGSNSEKLEIVKGEINVNSLIDFLVRNEDALKELAYTNDFTMDYVNYVKSMPKKYYNDIQLKYGIDITASIYTDYQIFKTNAEGKRVADNTAITGTNTRTLSLHAITEYYTALLEQTPYKDYSSLITNLSTVMSQSVSNNEYISSQYDILTGTLPQKKEDIVLVLGDNDTLTDLMLAQLGYYTEDQFYNMIYKAGPQEMRGAYKESLDVKRFKYEDLLGRTFTWYPNDKIYTNVTAEYNGKSYQRFAYNYEANTKTVVEDNIYTTAAGGYGLNYDLNMKYVEDDWSNSGLKLNICGIVRRKANIQYGALSTGLLYQEDLARYIISQNQHSEIANSIKENGSIYSINQTVSGFDLPIGIFYKLNFVYDKELENETYENGSKNVLVGKSNTGIMKTFMSYIGSASPSSGANMASSGASSELMQYLNLKTMDLNGVAGTYLPEKIEVYPVDFNSKYLVTDYLDKWNDKEKAVTIYKFNDNFDETTETYELAAADRTKIKYTDSIEIIIKILNTMVDIVTIALVIFTALSLVVSTVMVAIITYVSVVERIKEIGVIRSLGGRKKDVSHLFNAETVMIGLASGIFGVLVTLILSVVGNIIVNAASGGMVSKIANLTWVNALVMIALSVVLTTIAGIIPARSAAKKDPVVALRTE